MAAASALCQVFSRQVSQQACRSSTRSLCSEALLRRRGWTGSSHRNGHLKDRREARTRRRGRGRRWLSFKMRFHFSARDDARKAPSWTSLAAAIGRRLKRGRRAHALQCHAHHPPTASRHRPLPSSFSTLTACSYLLAMRCPERAARTRTSSRHAASRRSQK